jgi:hypothetical protein
MFGFGRALFLAAALACAALCSAQTASPLLGLLAK